MVYSYDDYVTNPFLATKALGQHLRDGQLNLFLGAGATFGLPEWAELVKRVTGTRLPVSSLRNKSDKELSLMVNKVDDGSADYIEKVYKALYSKLPKDLLKQLQSEPLLLSVAALITGTMRGRVRSIFTYNYDDTLERYLAMLGYSACVRTLPTSLSDESDVEINHVHGFLPITWSRPRSKRALPEIILSENSYRKRRSWVDKGWSSYVEHSLFSRMSLVVGMSGDDSAVLDVIKRANDQIKRSGDYSGYWLMTPNAFNRNATQILDVGMCPIKLKKDDIPQFLFQVCQDAAK